jgi:hypothetical protein
VSKVLDLATRVFDQYMEILRSARSEADVWRVGDVRSVDPVEAPAASGIDRQAIAMAKLIRPYRLSPEMISSIV